MPTYGNRGSGHLCQSVRAKSGVTNRDVQIGTRQTPLRCTDVYALPGVARSRPYRLAQQARRPISLLFRVPRKTRFSRGRGENRWVPWYPRFGEAYHKAPRPTRTAAPEGIYFPPLGGARPSVGERSKKWPPQGNSKHFQANPRPRSSRYYFRLFRLTQLIFPRFVICPQDRYFTGTG